MVMGVDCIMAMSASACQSSFISNTAKSNKGHEIGIYRLNAEGTPRISIVNTDLKIQTLITIFMNMMAINGGTGIWETCTSANYGGNTIQLMRSSRWYKS